MSGGDPREASGRGGSLGTPAMGDPPDELKPARDPDKGYAVSGGGMARPYDDEDAEDRDPDDMDQA